MTNATINAPEHIIITARDSVRKETKFGTSEHLEIAWVFMCACGRGRAANQAREKEVEWDRERGELEGKFWRIGEELRVAMGMSVELHREVGA